MKTPMRFAALLLAVTAAPALAQIRLPVIFPLGRSQPPPPQQQGPVPSPFSTPGALQADLVVKAGSDTVYFSPRGDDLNANARATLTAQARWLLANPFVVVRLEGHGGPRDSRDYALAAGRQRAAAVRDFLLLQGIEPQRIEITSLGKERPGTVRIGTSVVAAGPRVVTKVLRIQPPVPVFPAPPAR